MAENLPINFAVLGENAIATYSYSDLVEGTGMASFYPFFADGEYTTGTIYTMSPQLYYSSSISTVTTEFDGAFDKTFSLTAFNTPRTLGGTSYFTIPWYFKVSISDQVLKAYPEITLYKNSDVITTISGAWIVGSTGVDISKQSPFVATLPSTHYKKGDILKFKVRVVFATPTHGSSGTPIHEVGHDPMDRDGTYLTSANTLSSQMKINIPFKIDL